MRRSIFLLCFVTIAFLFTGCFKARVAIDVNSNGSGNIALAVGMTQQAIAFAGSDGNNVMQTLTETLAEDEGEKPVTTRRWNEGDYEWVEGSVPFNSLEELNGLLGDSEMFQEFSIIRERGILRDRFVLQGIVDPLMPTDEQMPEDLLIDPAGFFEFQIAVNLPGKVVDTNGIFEGDSSTVIWTISNQEPVKISATSIVTNWASIGIIAFLMFAVGIVVFGLLVIGLVKKKDRPIPSVEPVKKSSTANTISFKDQASALDSSKAFQLLKQVNQYKLQGIGIITESPTELRLVWNSTIDNIAKGEIVVRALDGKTLSINGKEYPATNSGVKQGLVNCLKELSDR